MRRALLVVLLGLPVSSLGGELNFDQTLVVAVARPYVEAYLRSHPTLKGGPFDWAQRQIIVIPDIATARGYVGVFSPARDGSGVGFACLKFEGDLPDRITPISWVSSEHGGSNRGV